MKFPTLNRLPIFVGLTRSTRRNIVLACAILLLATVLRLLDLGSGSVWSDEANHYLAAAQPFRNIFQNTRQVIFSPPLYTYLLHFWLKLGMSEAFLRFPSLLFSLLGVAGAMAVGHQLGKWRVALLAGFLMAIMPSDIRYAQEISQYGLMVALVFWSYYFLLKLVRSSSPEWRLSIGWVTLAILATYTHYNAVIAIIIPFGITFLDLWSRNGRKLKRDLVLMTIYGLSLLPLFIFYLPFQLKTLAERNALQVANLSAWSLIVGFGKLVINKVAFLLTGWPYISIPRWIPVVLVALLFLENLLAIKKSTGMERRWLIWLVSVIGLFSIYTLYSLSGWIENDPGRHGLFLLGLVVPFIALRLSLLLDQRWKKWLAVPVLIALAALCPHLFASTLPQKCDLPSECLALA